MRGTASPSPPRGEGEGEGAVIMSRVATTRRAVLALLVGARRPRRGARAAGPSPAPALGLDVNLPAGTSAAEQQRAFEAVARGTGVSLYALTRLLDRRGALARQVPGRRAHSARRGCCRQSGALLHLDLPLVVGRARDVPADLDGVAFDDSRLSLRLGRLLDALEPALARRRDALARLRGGRLLRRQAGRAARLPASLRRRGELSREEGSEARGRRDDATRPPRAPRPRSRRRSTSGARSSSTSTRRSSRAGRTGSASPDAIEKDWKAAAVRVAGERLIAFPEVSYSSSAENGSTPEQAGRLRAAHAEAARGHRRAPAALRALGLLARRRAADPPAPQSAEVERRRAAFFVHRGLQAQDGAAKPAWRAWVRAAK